MTRASCPWSHRNTDDTGGWEGHCANAQHVSRARSMPEESPSVSADLCFT